MSTKYFNIGVKNRTNVIVYTLFVYYCQITCHTLCIKIKMIKNILNFNRRILGKVYYVGNNTGYKIMYMKNLTIKL